MESNGVGPGQPVGIAQETVNICAIKAFKTYILGSKSGFFEN